MDKYKTVPVISADDGCFYVRNYAQMLYNLWLNNKTKLISVKRYEGSSHAKYKCGGGGYGILFPPNCFKHYGLYCVKCFQSTLITNPNDDRFLGILAGKLNKKWIWLKDIYHKDIQTFADTTKTGLSSDGSYKSNDNWFFEKMINTALKHGTEHE